MLPMKNHAEFQQMTPEDLYLHLKALVFQLIHDGPLAPKELAYELGRTYRNLLKCGEEAETAKNLLPPGLLKAIDLQQAWWLLEHLVGLFDFVLFKRPRALNSILEINRQGTAVLRENTAAVQAMIAGLDPDSPGGPQLTRAEKEAIHRQIAAAQASLAAMGTAVEQLYESQRPHHPHNPLGD